MNARGLWVEMREMFKPWTALDEANYQEFLKITEINEVRERNGVKPLESYAEGFERVKRDLERGKR